jgi:m7GpppX diphosphatase
VKPYIAAFPSSRTNWVDEITSGRKEAEKVLHRDESGAIGYLIIPDMKWDLETVSSLYLLALATDHGVESLRDLRKSHLPALKDIIVQANRIAKERWGLDEGSLRFYIHYQPSYCECGYL